MTWHSTNRDGYPVARYDGHLIELLFGKHKGATLDEVPDSYLRWLTSANGRAFLPAAFIELVADELARREGGGEDRADRNRDPDELPDLRDGVAVVGWLECAVTGEIAEALAHVRRIETIIDQELTSREIDALPDLLRALGDTDERGPVA